MLELNPREIKVLLKYSIEYHAPIIVVGDPGVGKTAVARETCIELNTDFQRSTLSIEDSTKPEGFPWIDKDADHAKHVPFASLYKAHVATKSLVWFLDDVGQAPIAVQAGYMPMLEPHGQVNGITISPHVSFIAATNNKGHTGSIGLIEPFKSRFTTIVNMKPDLDLWLFDYYYKLDYAVSEIAAYLRSRPGKLMEYEPTSNLVNSPSPRTWDHAAHILYQKFPASIEMAALAGAIGEATAIELLALRKLITKCATAKEIIADPKHIPIPDDANLLYITISNLVFACDEHAFPSISVYINRLFNEGPEGKDRKVEFAAALLNDCFSKVPGICSLPEFEKLARSKLGSLCLGNYESLL